MSAKLHLHAAPATAVSLAVILALAVTGLVALSSASTSRSRASGARRSAPAASPQPQCGDTITADTTLHHNLVNCPNNGIVIGADNITLDLNYHTIDGDGTPAAGCDPNAEVCDSGVVDDGHDGVTVVHGQVREFEVGVLFGTSTAGRVRHNRVIDISSSKNLFSGFVVASSTRSLVRNSSGSGNLAPEGNGIAMFVSHHVRVLHNTFRNNGDHGIFVRDSNHNLIDGNLLSDNHIGILVQSGDLPGRAARNRVRHNRSVRDRDGIVVDKGQLNVIARNHVSESGRIEIEGGRGNLFAHNVVVRSASDGVHVDSQAKHMLLRRNLARHSKDDGFDVEGRTTKLTRNRAVGNGDLGIEAVRGVIDGGGNKASGNGDLRQCTNIVCR